MAGFVREIMNEEEVEVCLAMEHVLKLIEDLQMAEKADGMAKTNEKARFYAVARTHQQTALAYFEYWLTQHIMFKRLQAGNLE